MTVRIGSYKLRKAGERGAVLEIPRVWREDVGARTGDMLDVLRDESDRLIVVPSAKKGGGEA